MSGWHQPAVRVLLTRARRTSREVAGAAAVAKPEQSDSECPGASESVEGHGSRSRPGPACDCQWRRYYYVTLTGLGQLAAGTAGRLLPVALAGGRGGRALGPAPPTRRPGHGDKPPRVGSPGLARASPSLPVMARVMIAGPGIRVSPGSGWVSSQSPRPLSDPAP